MHVSLCGRQHRMVTLENREGGIERLQDVAKVAGSRSDPAIGSRRRSRDDTKRRDAQVPENGFESEPKIGFSVGESALTDTENGEGVADPFGNALLVERGHIWCDTHERKMYRKVCNYLDGSRTLLIAIR